MPEGSSLINIGEISKPATVLIEKISDAVGGYFRPHQIRRIAKAEAEAEKVKAVAQIEVSELQQRALRRFVAEEAKKQDNIEAITAKALRDLDDKADPSKMEDDWIANFFDKCRLVSDEEMQALWGKVLAGEANSPGHFSKRTRNYLSSLDKADAELFVALCGFACYRGEVLPLIYDLAAELYKKAGVSFLVLKHLSEIGLLTFESLAGFKMERLPKRVRLFYYGDPVDLEFPKDADNELQLGKVLLSKVGQELARVCNPKPVDGFVDYLVGQWMQKGVICSSPFPRADAA